MYIFLPALPPFFLYDIMRDRVQQGLRRVPPKGYRLQATGYNIKLRILPCSLHFILYLIFNTLPPCISFPQSDRIQRVHFVAQMRCLNHQALQ